MIEFAKGNLLESDAEALVNTVNTVGVMGKGIALMFKEAFPKNFDLYAEACNNKSIKLGEIFATKRADLYGPRWIVNFPTKSHWRYPSKIEWIVAGLKSLKEFIEHNDVKSIALPPLGAGNGGLDWLDVKTVIIEQLKDLDGVRIIVFEPTSTYQNVAKRSGVEKLTPARAVIAEIVRRYSILGIDCSLLEVQKLGYFIERFALQVDSPELKFGFTANRYGPYSDRLKHLLNSLDGSYLHCSKRLSDAGPFEPIMFDDARKGDVGAYLTTNAAQPYRKSLEATTRLIDGFESPVGMELLATVDWMVFHDKVAPDSSSILQNLPSWTGGSDAGHRKLKLFEPRMVDLALEALSENELIDQ